MVRENSARLMAKQRRRMWKVIGVFLCLLGTVSLVFVFNRLWSGASDGEHLGYDEVRREVQVATTAVEWPEDIPSDDLLLAGLEGSTSDRFEQGFGDVLVRFGRACAWREAWFDANDAGDRNRMEDFLPDLDNALRDVFANSDLGT